MIRELVYSYLEGVVFDMQPFLLVSFREFLVLFSIFSCCDSRSPLIAHAPNSFLCLRMFSFPNLNAPIVFIISYEPSHFLQFIK